MPPRRVWGFIQCFLNKSTRPGSPSALKYRLQYTNENGAVKPLEQGILNVTVTGGKLLGLSSACPYNKIGYLTDKTDIYYGEALAVVQAGEGEAVELTVTDGKYTGKAAVAIR